MRALAALSFFLLAGCYDTSGPVPAEPVFGRYVLASVDGSALPATYVDQPNLKLEFIRGVLRLNQDGTFVDSTEVRSTANNASRRAFDVASGTFVHTTERVDLTSTRGEHYFMTISSRMLKQELGGMVLVYRR